MTNMRYENISVLLSRSGSHADRFKASSCEWSERGGDNSRTIRNKRNGGAAGPLESRASEKGEKRMTALGIGAYWSNWWSAPNQEQPARERPPWECQLSNHKLIWKGKLITRSSCRALCRAEDFPIEICKYFSACFVCANGQEIGENVAAGRAIAGIKAGN